MSSEKPRILVLDDETQVGETLEQFLLREGFEAVAVGQRGRAVELLAPASN